MFWRKVAIKGKPKLCRWINSPEGHSLAQKDNKGKRENRNIFPSFPIILESEAILSI